MIAAWIIILTTTMAAMANTRTRTPKQSESICRGSDRATCALREAWECFHLSLAATEAHHGCLRDEQVRWLMEVWNAAKQLKSEGVDIRAVTVWSIFGALDWNTLLVQKSNFYEPGF